MNLFIASVGSFTKGKVDKNGLSPVILNVVAGKCPNRNVISGTVAESMKIKSGNTYLFSCREVEADEYGRKFNFTALREASVTEIISGSKELGIAEVYDVAEVVGDPKEPIKNAKTEFSK